VNTVSDHLLWLRQAEQDLQQAKDSMRAGRYEWAAYAAQQSAEKNLKGILIFAGAKFEYTHQLVILARQIEEAGISIADLPSQDDLLMLAEQNQLARYPMNDLAPRDAVTENRAIKSIQTAKVVEAFVGSLL
jgi:HEPN domain-containing protein